VSAGDRESLRERALQRLRDAPQSLPIRDEADVRRLLHELQVHQVELELQNEELQRARCEAESTAARYAELYDQAPVGYLTLDDAGVVRQANLAAVALLGGARERLLGRKFTELVERMDRPSFANFLQRLVGTSHGSCEVSLDQRDADLRIVRIDGRLDGDGRLVRITLSDVTRQRLSTLALQRSETQLRRAYRQLAGAQECERLRLTEQLHDQVGRNLTALGLNLSIIEQALPPELGLHERLQDSIGLLQAAVSQVRGVMSDLYPPMLIDYGLFAALRWWASEVARRSRVEVCMVDGDLGLRQPAETESALFRIAQEAIANAIRHGRPRRVEISLRQHHRGVRLEISDDGRGFDADAVVADDERASWGLTMMRERALAIGAELHIDSAAGRGTRISVDTEANRR